MLQTFYIFVGLSLIGLFFGERIKAAISSSAPRYVVAWDYIVQASGGIVVWFLLYAFTAALLQENLFPNQSIHIFSGDPVSLYPALGWGAIIAWVASGTPDSLPTTGTASTVDARLAALGRTIWTIVRLAGWAAAIIAFGLLVYLFGTWLESALEAMPPARAILVGSCIIALAVYLGLKSRKS